MFTFSHPIIVISPTSGTEVMLSNIILDAKVVGQAAFNTESDLYSFILDSLTEWTTPADRETTLESLRVCHTFFYVDSAEQG